jgi:glycosidase
MTIILSGCRKSETNGNLNQSESIESNNDNNNSVINEDQNKNNNETNVNVEADTVIIDETQDITVVPYKYEQELNVIDDNNRNYYEIFVYSFYDSDGDGVGDIKGIISKLDYINDGDDTTNTDLGFNGIWLMPIMPSTTYHKYDVTDYYNIDPQYGTLEDFKNLIEECDKRGIKLIIDFVFNHTSAKHPWFLSAVSYLEGLEEGEEPDLTENPYVGYYHFTKDYNGSSTYHRAGKSDWYYECVFWDQMPDLALESEALRGEIEQIAKFWLNLGVGGFRLDAAKEFYSGEKERNVEVLKWFKDYVKGEKEDAYIVAEVWDEAAAIATYYESGVPSMFNFPLSQHNGLITNTVRKLGTTSGKSFANTLYNLYEQYRKGNTDFIDAPFISNHDTTRISAQCVNNEEQMKMAAGVLLTMNGSPFVYYGEEIGMNSKGSKDENKRLPMQWSLSDTNGMTNAPSGAEKVEQKFPPVDEQLEKPLSLLNYYKRGVRIRNENPEIARGEISVIEELCSKEISAIKKVYNGSEIVIIYNLNSETETVNLKEAGLSGVSIRGYLTVDGSEVVLNDQVMSMPKNSIVILK